MPLTLANGPPIWLACALYSARTSGPAIASSERANVASGGVVSVSAAFVPLDVDFTKTPFSFLRMKFLTALNVQRPALHGLGGLGSCSDLADCHLVSQRRVSSSRACRHSIRLRRQATFCHLSGSWVTMAGSIAGGGAMSTL